MIIYEQERSNKNHYVYHQSDTNLTFPIHMHNSYEFITVLAGEIEIVIEDKTYTLEQDDCTLIMPNKAHSYSTPDFSQTHISIFSVDYVSDFYKKTENKSALTPIFRIDNAKEITYNLQNAANIFELKSELYKIISIFYESTEFEVVENQNVFVHEVIQYIENHLQDDVTLHSLADELGYTYNYTSTMFNQSFKINFSTFLNNCRISQSVSLLTTPDYTISEIAAMCGYNSLRAFNRNFLKIKGTTPTEYRKNFENN